MARPRGTVRSFPVSIAKARFLELVREVERGKRIEITKDGKVVAQLVPSGEGSELPVTGFASGLIEVKGDITAPIGIEWTYDQDNLEKPGPGA